MSLHLKKFLYLSLLLFLFALIIEPNYGHSFDMSCWVDWTKYIYENGLGNAYNSWLDYPPLYLYILKIFGALVGDADKIKESIHYLKLVTLLFHIVAGYFLIIWLKTKEQNWDELLFKLVFYLFNIAILYNGIIWGQVDIILSSLMFIAAYYAFKKRIVLSLIFLVLALNFKLQAIIFIPLVGLMLLPLMFNHFSLKNLLSWVLLPLLLQVLILLPFIFAGTLNNLLEVIFESFGKYPSISMNAYNFWYFVFSGDLMQIRDDGLFLGLSYKRWGLILFFTTSFVALFPLLKTAFLAIKNRLDFNFSLGKYLIIAALIPLLFFYFNTQMHERYCHPAFIFLMAYSFYTRKYAVTWLACLAYLLNLESVLKFLNLSNYGTLIFEERLIAGLFLISIILLYKDLYSSEKPQYEGSN